MDNNQSILLEAFLAEHKAQFGDDIADSELFELFSIEQVLKDYDLSYEEIKDGIVDGGSDGGIDAIYMFANDVLIAEDTDLSAMGKSVRLNLVVVQAKSSRHFREDAVDKIDHTIKDIFDFSKDPASLHGLYNAQLLGKASLFKGTYLELAKLFPELNVEFYYATKGGEESRPQVLRADRVKQSMLALFPDCSVTFEFLGCAKLVSITRRSTVTSLALTFSDGPLATESGGIVGLVKLQDYYNFISGNERRIRSGLFEFNVRDYQGRTEVNNAIKQTLIAPEGGEFWWLNNGITILCKRMNSSSKTITLEDPQVVNGLQTSSEVFEYCRSGMNADDQRSILVRIIQPEDDLVRDRIIKATNSQTAMPGASLRATDPFQRDIEEFFLANGYFYDRRKNFYKNQGKPTPKIVGIPLLAQAFMAIVLGQPDNARARPTSLLKDDDRYKDIFNPDYPLAAYTKSVEILRRVDEHMKNPDFSLGADLRNNLRYHLAMMVTAVSLGTITVTPALVAQLSLESITCDLLTNCYNDWHNESEETMQETTSNLDQIAKSKEFVTKLKKCVEEMIQKKNTPSA